MAKSPKLPDRDLPIAPPPVQGAEDWQNTRAALTSAYGSVNTRATEIVQWYQKDKRSKRRWSRILRLTGLLLATGGGIVPLASALNPQIPGQLGYILLAVAAGTIAIDRFYGLSNGWMRDMRTITSVNLRLATFRFDWAETVVDRKAETAAIESAQLALLKAVALDLESVVGSETSEWVSQFRSGLIEEGNLHTHALESLEHTAGDGQPTSRHFKIDSP